MQPAPPNTPLETNMTAAYQILGSARMQANLMHQSVPSCMAKCLDTEDLYTLQRSTAPIKYRLEKDLKEKLCVSMCQAKWDELYRRSMMAMNKRETAAVQTSAMLEMMRQQGGM